MNQLSSTRIFYDNADKVILSVLHRVGGGLPRKEIIDLKHVDIPFYEFNYMTHDIIGIDENGQPILELLSNLITYDTRILDLENELLLKLDNEIGGII